MKRHLQEAALPLVPYAWRAGDGLRLQHPVTYDPETSGPFGHEHVAVGQERERPGVLESFDDRDDAIGAAF